MRRTLSRSGRDAEGIGHERVDFGPRLVHAQRVDRKDGVEQSGDAGCVDGGGEHARRAVGEDGGAQAACLEVGEAAGVGKCVER